MPNRHPVDFDKIADELYGLEAEKFVAARNAYVAQARKARQPDLAKALKALAKPTRSAALVNTWVRKHGKALFELGRQLREAHGHLEGEKLRKLAAERRELLEKAVDEMGKMTDAVQQEVIATLGAALADEEAAAQVKAGRLTRALEFSGFGNVASVVVKPPARQRKEDDEDRRKEREAAEAAAARCQVEFEQAESHLAAARRALEKARQRLDELKESC